MCECCDSFTESWANRSDTHMMCVTRFEEKRQRRTRIHTCTHTHTRKEVVVVMFSLIKAEGVIALLDVLLRLVLVAELGGEVESRDSSREREIRVSQSQPESARVRK